MNQIKHLTKLLMLILPVIIYSQNPGDKVFSGIQVHTIKIHFSQVNYWDSLTAYYDQGNEQYMVASVMLDGVTIDSCGVRLKGNSSYSHPNNKKSMKIDFDEYRSNQRWDGLKGIHVNNCFSDPTFIREKIHLDYCHDAGIDAPRANYAMVYINDEVWGLYSIVEPVDKKFLSTHYGNKDGNLYKAVDAFGGANQKPTTPVDTTGGQTNPPGGIDPGTIPGGTIPGGTTPGGTVPGTIPGGTTPGGTIPGGTGTAEVLSDFCWYGTVDTSYTSHYELKTEESTTPWTDLIAVSNILNNSTNIETELSEKVDLKTVYKAIGTDIIFANLDSYTGSGRNFYVYFNSSTKKMEWIIWDVNMSFGGYPAQNATPETLSLTYTTSTTGRPLVGKIFNSSSLKAEYLKTVSETFGKYFSTSRLFPHIDSIAAFIRPYVILDTKKQYTIDQFDENISNDITITNNNGTGGQVGGGSERKPGIKSFITARLANIKTQFANLGITAILAAEQEAQIPEEFELSQNYPNPFNPSTVIEYRLPEACRVILKVYNVLGEEVAVLADEYKAAGSYKATFNTSAKSLASGIYFYKIIAGNFTQINKMLLLK
jgi:hypothetical protein